MIKIDDIQIQMPSEHGWNKPDTIGVSGIGQEIISGVWSYFMNFDGMFADEYSILWNLWKDNINQMVSVYLPEIGFNSEKYTYKYYSGTINPPEYNNFYEGSYDNVKLIISGISIL